MLSPTSLRDFTIGDIRLIHCSSGANLQRSCDSISPYGTPPLICGRPFKEAVAAPSLLTGLGLDSSKRLLCSRQSQRGRGAPPSSKQLPPLETQVCAHASQRASVSDQVFARTRVLPCTWIYMDAYHELSVFCNIEDALLRSFSTKIVF